MYKILKQISLSIFLFCFIFFQFPFLVKADDFKLSCSASATVTGNSVSLVWGAKINQRSLDDDYVHAVAVVSGPRGVETIGDSRGDGGAGGDGTYGDLDPGDYTIEVMGDSVVYGASGPSCSESKEFIISTPSACSIKYFYADNSSPKKGEGTNIIFSLNNPNSLGWNIGLEQGSTLPSPSSGTSNGEVLYTGGITSKHVYKLICGGDTGYVTVDPVRTEVTGSFTLGIVSCSPNHGEPEISMAWDASSNATSYEVYRKTWSSGSWSLQAALNQNQISYTDSDAKSQGNYYRVTAYNSAGQTNSNEAYSDCNSPPDAPTISGPTTGNPNTSYTYSFLGFDADQDNIRYGVDWDMDSVADTWLPSSTYIGNGVQQSTTHSWSSGGSKNFKALTQDNTGVNSSWTTYNTVISGVDLGTNGQCGTAKVYPAGSTSFGGDSICSAGNPSVNPPFPTNGSSSTWYCAGTNGGANSAVCTASLLQNRYTLTVTKTTGGKVESLDSNINCGTTCSHSYAEDDVTTLTATPSSSYWKFNGWSFVSGSGSCSGIGTCQVTMNGAKNIKANFVLRLFDYKEF